GFNQHFIPFELELQFIRTYIEIEKVRLGDRLNVRIDVDHEVLQQQVPSMFLQPLVENAIVHGIAKRAEGGRVHICGCCEDTTLSFEVRDSGRGIPPRELERVFDRGLGLANTQKRLERIYGDQFQMSIRNIEPRGLSVQLKFPQKAS
ncbi:MAG: sensor histidine kinase, partial [bacterium]